MTAGVLLLFSPIVFVVAIVAWIQDFHSPFYVAPRAGRGGGTFKIVKFRSMTVGPAIINREGWKWTGGPGWSPRNAPLGHIQED